jgi:aspartate aminotransferase
VAKKLCVDNRIPATADGVVITPGAKNALFVACAAVLRPGDEVINLTPCYVSNCPILRLSEPQAVIRNVPLDPPDFKFNHDLLLSAINPRTQLILINYPNNPTGVMLDRIEAEFLRDLIVKHGLYVVTDEIYERLILTDKPHISLASLDGIGDRVITVNGFSKAYAMTGWRIGYTYASPALTSRIVKIHQQLNTNTAAFIQKAALAALQGDNAHLSKFISRLKERAQIVDEFVQHNSHIRATHIEGGFFSFFDVSAARLRSDAFCSALLDAAGVAMIPGVSFGADFDSWVRVSISVSTENLENGLQLFGEFINRRVEGLCKK